MMPTWRYGASHWPSVGLAVVGAAVVLVPPTAVIGLPLAALLLGWRRARFGAWVPHVAARWPALALVAVVPLSLFAVVNWSLAVPRLAAVLGGVTVAFALVDVVRSERGLLVSAAALLAGGGALALLSPVIAEWPLYKTPVLPALAPLYALFPQLVSGVVIGTARGGIHVNQLAGVATALLPLGVVLWAFAPTRWIRGVAAISSLLLGGLLLLSQSRSGYLGAATGLVAALAWATMALRPSRPWAWIAGLAASVVTLGVLLGPMLSAWVTASEAAYDSLAGRRELWDRALLMLRDMPVTGVGPGQFSLVLHRWYEPLIVPPGSYVPHAHNVLLQLALDLGLFGMVASLALVVTVVVQAVRAASSPATRLVAIGVGAGFVGFAVYGMTDAIAIGARGALPLWVLLGLGIAVDGLARANTDNRHRAEGSQRCG